MHWSERRLRAGGRNGSADGIARPSSSGRTQMYPERALQQYLLQVHTNELEAATRTRSYAESTNQGSAAVLLWAVAPTKPQQVHFR